MDSFEPVGCDPRSMTLARLRASRLGLRALVVGIYRAATVMERGSPRHRSKLTHYRPVVGLSVVAQFEIVAH